MEAGVRVVGGGSKTPSVYGSSAGPGDRFVTMDEMALLKRSGGPVTRTRLSRDLAALGLAAGDVVMFHTRMSALGYVAGGPETVIGALQDVVGPHGTLMVTCGWNDAPPYEFVTWPQEWQDALRARRVGSRSGVFWRGPACEVSGADGHRDGAAGPDRAPARYASGAATRVNGSGALARARA